MKPTERLTSIIKNDPSNVRLFKYSENKWSYISKPSVKKSSYLTSNVRKPNSLSYMK